jgi:hypothetical protein
VDATPFLPEDATPSQPRDATPSLPVDATDVAEWLERLTANAKIATVLGSIPASSVTAESEGKQMKQC